MLRGNEEESVIIEERKDTGKCLELINWDIIKRSYTEKGKQIQWQDPQSRQWRDLTFPNCFLLFGIFRSIEVVDGAGALLDTWA